MASYHKAAVVGVSLLGIVVAVIAIGYFSIQATYRQAETIVYRYYPALTQILFIDRDLYQAQMALERAARESDPSEREVQISVYRENLGQTADRFETFQNQMRGIPDPLDITGSYQTFRRHWTLAVDEFIEATSRDVATDELEVLADQIGERFVDMRFALDRFTESVLNPLIQTGGEQMTAKTREYQRTILAALVVALLLGGWLTVSGVGAIRRQHKAMLAEKAESDVESERKEIERRVQQALELVQTEDSALDVMRDALDEIISSTHQTEVLLADSSMAHLKQVLETAPSTENGCKVLEPHECPAIRRNSSLYFPDSTRFEACPFLKNRESDGCSASCIPVSVMGQAAGVLHTVGPRDSLPTHQQNQDLTAVACRAGDAIGMIRAFASKDQQANIDSLTGLNNRRSLEALLPQVTSKGAYSVAFADLDQFKILNDTYGHDAGDKALRLFGDVLRATLRPGDKASRWGGEEFVIVLPDVVGRSAVFVLERLRDRLRDTLALGLVPTFTVSIGVSDSDHADCFEDVLIAADRALLVAKTEGRDRVVYDRSVELESAEDLGDTTIRRQLGF